MTRTMSRWTVLALAGCMAATTVSAQTTSATGAATPDASVSGLSPNPNPPGSGRDVFVRDTEQRTFVVTGIVVRSRDGQLVLRIDDHHHTMPFDLAAGAEAPVPGTRVSVTYRPTGDTGQRAEQVRVLQGARRAVR